MKTQKPRSKSRLERCESARINAMKTLLSNDATLKDILVSIVHYVEAGHPKMICSILLLNESGNSLWTYAAPHLPKFFSEAINGTQIGPTAGSCGTSAYLGRRIIVEDIRNSPLWKDYQELASRAELRSCWSEPIRGHDGRVYGTFAIYHHQPHEPSEEDIETIASAAQLAVLAIERKKTEEELRKLAVEKAKLLALEQEARSSAEKVSLVKDEFLATLSHELRTPLTTIMAWIQILRRGSWDSQVARGLEIIESSAKAQGQLIDDLLDLSLIEAKKLKLEPKELDIRKLVSLAVESTRKIAADKLIDVDLKISPQVDSLKVLGDPIRFEQILWNLLNNASKFTQKSGRIAVSIDQTKIRDAVFLRMTISDSGRGINAEFLPYIFQPFTQADSSSTRTYQGLGLGLSIVRKLVELHNGTIEAASLGDGKGASFTVLLPAELVVQKEMNRDSTPPLTLQGISVLVVEDDPPTREALTLILTSYGATVKTFESASKGLEAIFEFKPDVLVSDIAMPSEDGYSLIRRLRSMQSEVSKTPALALTAYAGKNNIEKALSAGFHSHMAKPVEADRLVQMIYDLKLLKQVPSTNTLH